LDDSEDKEFVESDGCKPLEPDDEEEDEDAAAVEEEDEDEDGSLNVTRG
jgi:hypothetical protein